MKRQLVAVLDNIRSLYNVGSMFRTADAFGVEHMYLCGMTGTPEDELNRTRIHKTALGAEETVAWSYHKDVTALIKKLQADGFTVLALEQTPEAVSLFDRDGISSDGGPQGLLRGRGGAIALTVGHEVYGVSERALQAADHHIHIPMLGHKESLNVSVSFGIAVSQLIWN